MEKNKFVKNIMKIENFKKMYLLIFSYEINAN